jgi:hypothetical protein
MKRLADMKRKKAASSNPFLLMNTTPSLLEKIYHAGLTKIKNLNPPNPG